MEVPTLDEMTTISELVSSVAATQPDMALAYKLQEWVKSLKELESDPVAKLKFGADALQQMDTQVEVLVSLSTAHIAEETGVRMSAEEFTGVYERGKYGWMVYTDGDTIGMWEQDPNVPADLIACAKWAHERGAVWLLLDLDAATHDALPKFDW